MTALTKQELAAMPVEFKLNGNDVVADGSETILQAAKRLGVDPAKPIVAALAASATTQTRLCTFYGRRGIDPTRQNGCASLLRTNFCRPVPAFRPDRWPPRTGRAGPWSAPRPRPLSATDVIGLSDDARRGLRVTRPAHVDLAPDHRLREGAHVADWREAFHYGQAKATGVPQLLKLIERVVDMHEERMRLRRSRQR